MQEIQGVSRRQVLLGLGAGAVALAASSPAMAALNRPKASVLAPIRSLSFQNLHTGETIKKITYFEYGNYVPDALADINKILRDHRTNDVAKIDPKLMDLLFALTKKLDSTAKIEIISGYRSPKSNAMLRKTGGGGVAKKSLHMEGKAIDLKLADRSLTAIRDAAKQLGLGGVGYYGGQFVHVDTGRVRSW